MNDYLFHFAHKSQLQTEWQYDVTSHCIKCASVRWILIKLNIIEEIEKIVGWMIKYTCTTVITGTTERRIL